MKKFAEIWHQRRSVDLLQIERDTVAQGIELTDDEIKSYFDENQAQFMQPERVKVRFISIDLDEMAAAEHVAETELQEEYERRQSEYTTEAVYNASHILFNLAGDADEATDNAMRARAQEMYEAIQSGAQSFDDAAASIADLDDVEFQNIGRIFANMTDSSFEEALHGLTEVGQVSEPVKTSNGWHIIRLDAFTPKSVQPLESVRDRLVQEIQHRRVEGEFYDLAERLATLAFENPDSLQGIADDLGLTVRESGWITRQSGEDIGAFAAVREAAFSPDVINDNLNSETIEISPTRAVVVRKSEHEPAAPLGFDVAKPQVESQLRNERIGEQIKKISEDLLAKVKEGADMASLAVDGKTYEQAENIKRDEVTLDRRLLMEAFRLPLNGDEPAYGSVAMANGDQAIIAVRAGAPGTIEDIPEEQRSALRRQFSSSNGSQQFSAFLEARREAAEIVTFPDRFGETQ